MFDPLAIARADREALLDQGWVRLRAIAGADELAAMHAAWERLAAQQGAAAGAARAGANMGPDQLQLDPAFACCLQQPQVMGAVAVLLGQEIHLHDMHGRAPPQGHGRQGLHMDGVEPGEASRQLIANAFWLMDDMDADNGPTHIVPRSHIMGRMPKRWAQPGARHPDECALGGKAGDVIVFSGHLWHRGSLNRSGRRRRVAIANFGRSPRRSAMM